MNKEFGAIPSERRHFVLVAVLFFNLVLVSTHVVLKNQQTLFQTIIGFVVSPVQVVFQKTADFVSYEVNRYFFLKNSFDNYQEIKRKYTRLKYENYILKKKLLGNGNTELIKGLYTDFIKVDVISIDRNFPLSSVMINKGSNDGIIKNMIVLNEEAELVGRVVEPISPFSANVRLITSSQGGVGAYVEKNQLEGLLTGTNTDICNFKYLVADQPVFVDDRIVTSGTDEIFTPYIPIGVVVEVQKDYLIQKVSVKPFFIAKPIKHLLVIKKD
ncbi:MAG TPA: rod shape-determining protein MreC [Candidatus Deferrimicrobium sp.]|nr:rod shape-determining protein MreC [Candidatus Kapabacteria bacterium]HLP62331.1 rod shape-determining protein MreC [Candidatus Deferrimicrobium sp.]